MVKKQGYLSATDGAPKGVLFVVLAVFIVILAFSFTTPTQAATGLNEQLNFQARLLNSDGSLVDDGNYHVRFKIYRGGDGALGGGDETQEWTEAHSTGNLVRVANGYLSVQLNSITDDFSTVSWNDDTLWLSMEIGGTAGAASWDGEMDPFMRLGSVPQAFNSQNLEGRRASEFVQLDPGASPQDVNTANSAIAVNQQGAGNLLQLQGSGADVLTVNTSGDITTAGDITLDGNLKVDNNQAIQFELAAGGAYRSLLTLGVTDDLYLGYSTDIKNLYLRAGTGGTIFQVGGTEVGRVESSGQFTIGTSSLQGASIMNDGNGNTATIETVAALGANVTYQFGAAAAGTYEICTDEGNCGGASLFTDGGTATYLTSTSDNLVVGATSAATGARFTVVGGSGRLSVSSTEADATNKISRFSGTHYSNSEEPFDTIIGTSTAGSNVLNIGGGSSIANAATSTTFYTATNNTTLTGTERLQIQGDGDVRFDGSDNTLFIQASTNRVGIGTDAPGYALDIAGGLNTTDHIFGNGKEIVRSTDSWLRLNANGDFTSGIYAGSSILRTDGALQSGIAGAYFSSSSAGTIINETGASVDLRVEGSTDTNLLVVDASSDNVGIGTATPQDKLTVAGGTLRVTPLATGNVSTRIGYRGTWSALMPTSGNWPTNGSDKAVGYINIDTTSTYLTTIEVGISGGWNSGAAMGRITKIYSMYFNGTTLSNVRSQTTEATGLITTQYSLGEPEVDSGKARIPIYRLNATTTTRFAVEAIVHRDSVPGRDVVLDNLQIVNPVLAANSAVANVLEVDGDEICFASGSCAGSNGYGDILDGGNTTGATVTVGTNDNTQLNLETNGITRLVVENDGDLNVDGATLFVSAGTNNVGIGDSAPTSKLDVQGNVRIGSGYDGVVAPTNGLIVEGNVGIGDSNPAHRLTVYKSTTDTSGARASYGHNAHTTNTSGTYYNFGVQGIASDTVAAGQTNSGYVMAGIFESKSYGAGDLVSSIGLRSDAQVTATATGNVTHASGADLRSINFGTGTISNAYGLRPQVLNLGAGSITNGYGVYITDISADNDYGIYQVAANDANYFAGSTGIGVTQPNEQLEIGSSGRVFFGDGGGASRKGLLIDAVENNASGDYARIESYDYGASSIPLTINPLGGRVLIGGQPAATGDDRLELVTGNLDISTGALELNDIIRVSNAGAFTGTGAAITQLNAGNISTGELADARLSTNVALLNGTQTFTAANTFSSLLTADGGIDLNTEDINDLQSLYFINSGTDVNDDGFGLLVDATNNGTNDLRVRVGQVDAPTLALGLNGGALITTVDTNENLIINPNGTGYTYFNNGNVYVEDDIILRGSVSDSTGNLTLNDTVDISGALNIIGLSTLSSGLLVAGDTITDFTGTGLSVSGGGALQVDSTSAAGFFQQNGNTFGTTAVLGTNDANGLNIRTNGLTRLTVEADGDIDFDSNTLFIDAASDAVGIGTNTPNTTLDVDGVISVKHGGITMRSYKDVYHASYSGTQTGTYEIVMPNTWTSTMMTAVIRGYDYSGGTDGGAWEVVVSGYNYAAIPNWHNYSAEIRGSAPFDSVRLAHDGTKNVILLGDVTTTWSYPKINIEQFTATHSASDNWGETWTGSFIVSEVGRTNIATPEIQFYQTEDTLTIGGVTGDDKLEVVGGNLDISTGALELNDIVRVSNAGAFTGTGAAITQLNAGNISTGVLGVARGGTGAGTFTAGGILYGNGTSPLASSAAGSAGQCLKSGGAGAPTWSSCSGAASTLQTAYAAGNTILTTNANLDLEVTVSEATNFTVDVTGTGLFRVQDSGVNVISVNETTATIDQTTVNIGTTTASSINIGSNISTTTIDGGNVYTTGNTAVLAGNSFTVQSGATSLTGPGTAANTLTVNNHTGTGSILVVQDAATSVFTIEDGGGVVLQNLVDTLSAYEFRNASGSAIFSIDTVNGRIGTKATTGAINAQPIRLRSGAVTSGSGDSGDININVGSVDLGTRGSINIGTDGQTNLVLGHSGSPTYLAASTLFLNSANWSRAAAGTTTINLTNAADTTLFVDNTGAGDAHLVVSGDTTVNGLISANNNLLLENGASGIIQARDSTNAVRNVLYGRWTDNGTFLDGGSYTRLRVNNGLVDAINIDITGNTTFYQNATINGDAFVGVSQELVLEHDGTKGEVASIDGNLEIKTSASTAGLVLGAYGASGGGGTENGFVLVQAQSFSFQDTTGYSDQFTIDSQGNTDIYGELTVESDSTAAFTINKDGSTPILVVDTSTNSAGGTLAIGGDITDLTGSNEVLIVQGDIDPAFVLFSSSDVAGYGALYRGVRSRGTNASPTPVVNGDELLQIQGVGYTSAGGNFNAAAEIKIQVEGTPTTTRVPGQIQFRTRDSSGTFAGRLVIRANGDVEVKGYATSTNIQVCRNTGSGALAQCTSLREYKEDIHDLNYGLSTVRQFTPRQFTWKENGLVDLGFIAEEVEAINPIFAQYEGNGDLSGVRYTQLTALNMRAIQDLDGNVLSAQDDINDNDSDSQTRDNALQSQITQNNQDITTLQNQLNALDFQNINTLTANEITAGELEVTGTARIDTLVVVGSATIAGDLEVAGTITTSELVVNGHIISGGDAPVVTPLVQAGLGAAVSVEGNDTSGTITIETGTSAVLAGDLVRVEFDNSYNTKPRIILTPVSADAVGASVFSDVTKTTIDEFIIESITALDPNTTYVFNYLNLE